MTINYGKYGNYGNYGIYGNYGSKSGEKIKSGYISAHSYRCTGTNDKYKNRDRDKYNLQIQKQLPTGINTIDKYKHGYQQG